MGIADEYVYEKSLQMQDPDKPRRQKLLQELENTNPVIKALHQLEAAKKEGHTKEAQVLAMQLQQMVKQMASQLNAPPQQEQLPAPQEQPPQQPPQQGMQNVPA